MIFSPKKRTQALTLGNMMPQFANNPYLDQIESTLPRILSLIDTDITSSSYGMADRFHWAWGLVDFPNGTFQGVVHGMARLWTSGLWPYPINESLFIRRIDSVFLATGRITRRDGSLEEAFPNEGSYCVTALVAFDLLCALDVLKNTISDEMQRRGLEIIRPLIGYLVRRDETHAVISNHLATALAALVRWYQITNDEGSLKKAEILRDFILEHQSLDGWFEEYDGADPGYQSLCVYYLADVHLQRPDWDLLEPLRRSFEFLWHFAHPDGSFGGLYGSRCTRFYYPSGALALANEIPEAAALSKYMEASIISQTVITLKAIDEPNLGPMFNSYVWAASLYNGNSRTVIKTNLPAITNKPFQRFFPHSGLFVDRGKQHYSIIATKKGGVVYHFIDKNLNILNPGVVIKNGRGHFGSSQTLSQHSKISKKTDKIIINSPIIKMPKDRPGPYQFIILRILSVTFFRVSFIREFIKRNLVKLLITRKKIWPCSNTRIIFVGQNLYIEDDTILSNGYETLNNVSSFVPIHMASQGYWQIQDEDIK